MTDPRIRRAAERIESVGRDYVDARGLREALLGEIARRVEFDAYAWVLTDPETEVGSDPLAEVPCFDELPRLIRLKYSTDVNRWTGMRAPVASLLRSTSGQPERALVWREMLSDYGVRDIASTVFRDRFGCWAFLDLWRTAAAAPFSDADLEYLAAIAPEVTRRLRRLQAATFAGAKSADAPSGPVVLVLSDDLQVRAQTAQTDHYLRALIPADGSREPVPAGAYNVGAQLIAGELGVDGHPARTRVYLQHGDWLTLSAARMTAAQATTDIAVTIEAASPHDRLDLFSRAYGLSRREADVMMALPLGWDTRRLAADLYVSENTIQDHLKSIFEKTGTRSRTALLARALGR